VFAAMTTGVSKADFVVGASGAVMALFGAWAARILKRFLQSRDVLDRQPAILMALIVLIQCAVDLSVPQISFTGHISGFIIGFVLALMMNREAGSRPLTA
jgi:rhomboid protease GluP